MTQFEKTKLLGSDFDDTITSNSMEIYTELYLRALGKIDVNMTAEDFREMVQPVWGQSSRDVISFTATLALMDQPRSLIAKDLDAAVEEYERVLRGGAYVEGVELVPGAIDTLQSIRERGVYVGVATGAPLELVDELMDKNGVPPDIYFHSISAYDIRKPERKKPHPFSIKRLRRVAEAVGSTAIPDDRIVYVGDSSNDVLMARALPDVEPVVVLTGNLTRRKALELSVPDSNILASICYIEEILERREVG